MQSTIASATQPSKTAETMLAKRLLRKGTKSCIECKRRKIRCFFLSARDSTCVGCQRRGVPCLGQEFADENQREEPDVAARLERVENLLQKIVEVALPGMSGNAGGGSSASSNHTPASAISSGTAVSPDTEPFSTKTPTSTASGSSRQHFPVQSFDDLATIYPHFPSGRDTTTSSRFYRCPAGYEQVCHTLFAALPSQHDASILIGTGRSSAFLSAMCNSFEEALFSGSAYEPGPLTLPDVSSHPVILARTLLQLALCIQQLEHTFDPNSLQLDDPLASMRNYVNIASELVTSNEVLMDSLEGLECLVIEGIYLVNTGNLRRALLHWRRAMTIAQFIGIDRPSNPRAPKILDPKTKASCPIIWFRILHVERYLSLLLGMPTSITSEYILPESTTTTLLSGENIDHLQAHIIPRIFNRSRLDDPSAFTMTLEIDYELHQAIKSLPAEWWEPLQLHPGMDTAEAMGRLIRAQSQVIHFNLLNVLHLPYMLRGAAEHRYDYSKATCMSASREVLNRYQSFRSIMQNAHCCRFVDFCALTASLTLLLAHLNSHQTAPGQHGLQNQRLEDRSLIERALVRMDDLNQLNGDELSRETASVARKLLSIESQAASGDNTFYYSDADTGPGSLRVDIPHFGKVSVHQQLSISTTTSTTVQGATTRVEWKPSVQLFSSGVHSQESLASTGPHPQWIPHLGIDSRETSSGLEIFTDSENREVFQGVDAAFLDAILIGDVSVDASSVDTELGTWPSLS